MTTLRVPLTASPKDPHVPILVSANLSTASRILVVFGEPNQDLGIWAYRSIGMEGINVGSAVSLVEHVLKPDPNTDNTSATGPSGKRIMSDTALILANTGQLIWHSGGERAITHASWLALPRRSAVDPPMTMTQRNKIPSNGNWQEHVECVFEEVLADRGRLVRSDARIDVIGVAEGGLGVLRYLRDDCMIFLFFHLPCLSTVICVLLIIVNRVCLASIHLLNLLQQPTTLHTHRLSRPQRPSPSERQPIRQF